MSLNQTYGNAVTMSTQGMVEADKDKALLRRVDEAICDALADVAIYGHDPKQVYLNRALNLLRATYPASEQNRDEGVQS